MDEEDVQMITIFHGENEWSALYINGKLDYVGDHYLVTERLEVLAGVDARWNNDFMCGGNNREDVAPTVRHAEQYGNHRLEKLDEAQELRREAARLVRRAQELEAG